MAFRHQAAVGGPNLDLVLGQRTPAVDEFAVTDGLVGRTQRASNAVMGQQVGIQTVDFQALAQRGKTDGE